MSTRCQIHVQGTDVILYRHSDGYPDGKNGVVAALKRIVSNFIKWRGFDECYLPAHIMADMIGEHKRDLDKLIRKTKKDKSQGDDYIKSRCQTYESNKYMGFGIEGYADEAAYLHGDIEFLYVVKKDGTIEVRQCWTDEEDHPTIANTRVIKTVKYSK